ncbi:MAG: hydroxymethylbilane synthase [Sediminibacterium sp.]|nr:hydroxymethylbilane synthase [Sediminibacterium sp.]
MKQKIRIVCRDSVLSLYQTNLFIEKVNCLKMDYIFEIIPTKSTGDLQIDKDLSLLEGTDFFTAEIFNQLKNNYADIAIHSLKDMSASHFFSHHAFAVIDRDDYRDIAIFNNNVLDKIENNQPIIIGTCSPRRTNMVADFLKKGLPQKNCKIKIQIKPIRGNVESRINKLHNVEYDGIILATAGLNRLLQSHIKEKLIPILITKKVMLLPIFTCTPAPCQGAIVVEANPNNKKMVDLLKKINNKKLFDEVYKEKKYAQQIGEGCNQAFGVVTINQHNFSYIYVHGKNSKNECVENWYNLPPKPKEVFSTLQSKIKFFTKTYFVDVPIINTNSIYVSNFDAIKKIYSLMNNKHIFVAGTKSWFKLAKQGYWVNGCADELGYESLHTLFSMPILKMYIYDCTIITNSDAALRWIKKGYNSIATYQIQPTYNKKIINQIKNATAIFWLSYTQYKYYKQFVNNNTTHYCLGGASAFLFKKNKIPITIFPTKKSFLYV